MHITALAHVCLRGADLDAMTHFYCDTLGLQKQFHFTRQGRVIGFYLKVADRSFIEVFEAAQSHESNKGSRLSHFCLETSSVEATRQRLIEAGYNPGPISTGADQSYKFWIQDPTGVDVEFHQYTRESSQTTGRDVEVNW